MIKDLRTAQEESKGDQRIITVLPEEVGKVLGRKGETVRIIERDSGAKVELNKTEGKVEIFGHLTYLHISWHIFVLCD